MVFDNVFHIGYLLNSNNVSTVYQLCHSILVVSKLSYPCMKGAESFRKSEFQLSLLCPRDCPFLVLVDLWIDNWMCIKVLKDKLCDKSLQKGLFKRCVQAIRKEREEI